MKLTDEDAPHYTLALVIPPILSCTLFALRYIVMAVYPKDSISWIYKLFVTGNEDIITFRNNFKLVEYDCVKFGAIVLCGM